MIVACSWPLILSGAHQAGTARGVRVTEDGPGIFCIYLVKDDPYEGAPWLLGVHRTEANAIESAKRLKATIR